MKSLTKLKAFIAFTLLLAFASPIVLAAAIQAPAGRVTVWKTEEQGLVSPSWPLGALHLEGREITNATALAAGRVHALIMCSDGRVIAIGDNTVGQGVAGEGKVFGYMRDPDGTGPYRLKSTFSRKDAGFVTIGGTMLTGVVAIAAAVHHNLALRSDGTVVGWGSDFSPSLYSVPDGLADIRSIACGMDADWFVTKEGNLIEYSQDRTQPIQGPENIVSLAATGLPRSNFVALQEDNKVLTGSALSGVRPLPQTTEPIKAVAAGWQILGVHRNGQVTAYTGYVPDGLTNITSVAVGSGHSMALRADGTVVAWSDRQKKILPVPEHVTGVIAIAVADAVSLAITTNQVIW